MPLETGYHEFIIAGPYVKAQRLKLGEKIIWSNLIIADGETDLER